VAKGARVWAVAGAGGRFVVELPAAPAGIHA
jgi:hypothetical protein